MILEEKPLRREVTKIVWRLLLGIIVAMVVMSRQSFLFELMTGLFLGLTAYTVHNLHQLARVYRWVKKPETLSMPESTGLWGHVFEQLHRRHQNSDRAYQQLLGLLEKARQSTDAWNDAIILLNSEGAIEWMNRSVKRLLGLRSFKDRGELLVNLVRDPRLSRYLSNQNYESALEIPAPGNPSKIIQFRVTSFGNNERLILVRDITRIRNLEHMRRDFVANVSHELKTPLTVLMGFLETMRDSESELPERWRRPVISMSDQAHRMKVLVDDLLLLSRLEDDTPRNPNFPVSLRKLLTQLCEDARFVSEGHAIELIMHEDVSILGQENELRSAFSNLIINAVKYTEAKNGVIEVRVFNTDKETIVSVEDNGIGIDATHIPRLTERFYRVDTSRHRSTGGTGLGLAIVKHVMIRHQGHLHIESAVGHGSVFSCHFPVSRVVRKQPA